MDGLHTFLSICVGIGLSAACGFRVFVPLLGLSLAAHTGHLHLDPAFAWIGGTPATVVFGVATIAEIAAYYIPFVDNLLDSIAVPAAAIAGTLVAALAMSDVDPVWRWTLAIIAGGGMATSTQLATTKLRAVSSATTAGVANPILSTAEAIAASVLSFVAVVWPILALGLALMIAVASWLVIYFVAKHLLRLFRRKAPGPAVAAAR